MQIRIPELMEEQKRLMVDWQSERREISTDAQAALKQKDAELTASLHENEALDKRRIKLEVFQLLIVQLCVIYTFLWCCVDRGFPITKLVTCRIIFGNRTCFSVCR